MKDARIVWHPGSTGYEVRAVLVGDDGSVLHEGRVIPYTFSERDEESAARFASARDVTEWAVANDVNIVGEGHAAPPDGPPAAQ